MVADSTACSAGRQRTWAMELLQAQRWNLGALGQQRQELYNSQDLTLILPSPYAPSSLNITRNLGNSNISETSVNNGPVFMVFQRPETLYQTNSSLQCMFA